VTLQRVQARSIEHNSGFEGDDTIVVKFVGDKKFGVAGAAYDSPDSVAERSSPPRQSWLGAHSTPALRSLVEIRVAVGPPSLIRYNNLRAVDSRDPCLLTCNALRCNALQVERSYDGAS
jgi:hypothetical protein